LTAVNGVGIGPRCSVPDNVPSAPSVASYSTWFLLPLNTTSEPHVAFVPLTVPVVELGSNCAGLHVPVNALSRCTSGHWIETVLSPPLELMFQVPEKSAANAAAEASSEPSASAPCVEIRMFHLDLCSSTRPLVMRARDCRGLFARAFLTLRSRAALAPRILLTRPR